MSISILEQYSAVSLSSTQSFINHMVIVFNLVLGQFTRRKAVKNKRPMAMILDDARCHPER